MAGLKKEAKKACDKGSNSALGGGQHGLMCDQIRICVSEDLFMI